MQEGNKDMEADVTTQPDDESIRMESDQIMENGNEHDFKQVTNQKPSHVKENFAPIEHVSNSLPTCIELVQPNRSKPVQPIQFKLVYIFFELLAIYI